MQVIELKIKVSTVKSEVVLDIECDENTSVMTVISTLEGTHSKIRQMVDAYMKKNNIFTKEAGKETYKTLKIKDLKL